MSAFSGSLTMARGCGSSRQTLRNAREFDGSGLADGAPEQRPLGLRSEPVAVLDDIAREFPGPGTREGTLLRPGVELVQEVGLVRDEEKHLGRDPVSGAPGEPVLGVDPNLEVDEARRQRGRHAVHDAAVGLAVAAGDERGALGELVLADLAIEHQLVQSRLYVESSVMLNVLDSYCMTGAEAGLWSHNISIGTRSESLQKGHYPVVRCHGRSGPGSSASHSSMALAFI